MRIAFDARKAADFGIGTYVRGLVHGIAAVDPTADLVLIGDPDAFPGAPSRADWIVERSPNYGLRELLAVGRAARAAAADVFHAPHYVFPLRLTCPGVVTIHDCIHLRFPEHLPRPLGVLPRRTAFLYARAMMRRAARQSARVITVSQASRQDLIERLGVPPLRISVIANGVARTGTPADAPARRARLGLMAGQPYVLFVGNAKPHKNLPLLIEAFGRLAGEVDALALVAAGRFDATIPALSALPATVRQRVRLLAHLDEDDLWSLYGGATAVCVPSRYEGFGLPALEAMRAGAPVIAANSGGLPEVIGDAGLLVPPDDLTALTGELRRLLRDRPLRDALSARGQARAASFTWEAAARATLDVYRRVAGTP